MKFPVSIKGIIYHNARILLLKNERNEWELPGGKLELDESPIDCLVREIFEETKIEVEVKEILDTWIYTIFRELNVLIITYICYEIKKDSYKISNEHTEGRWFSLNEIEQINIPQGYKTSIYKWYQKSTKDLK